MIDTHAHIFSEEFDGDIDEVMARAEQAGVSHMICPAIDSATHDRLLRLVRSYPGQCLPLIGLHPTSVNGNPAWRNELAIVENYLASPPERVRWHGVGEVGMDLYWSKDYKEEQEEAFVRQIELSLKYSLPLSVHVRDAWKETKEILRRFAGKGVKGVMHAFSGTTGDYDELKVYGDFMFGIGGVITYKKSSLPEVAVHIPLSDMVLETDSPYLPPVPFRGKRNESAYLPFICNKIAEIKGITPEEAALRTTQNAAAMFGIEK